MTKEEAIDILRVINPPRESKRIFDEFVQAIDMAIEALTEFDPEWRKKHYEMSYNQGFVDGCKSYEKHSEQKIGKWLEKQSLYGFGLIPVCSECEYVPPNREKYAFCPNCGASMRGSSNE